MITYQMIVLETSCRNDVYSNHPNNNDDEHNDDNIKDDNNNDNDDYEDK